MIETTTTEPHVVSRTEWLQARKNLLAKEKYLTRERDALAAERQRLPSMEVEKDYAFEGPNGKVALADLFGPYPQLIVYHFMFDPAWEEGCKGCSLLMDNVAGPLVHLGALRTSFAAISRAPVSKLLSFQRRMGWNFPWYSSADNSFNYDFQVTLTGEPDVDEYNFEKASSLKARGKLYQEKGEQPGLSVFLRDGSRILHAYSTYGRGLENLLNIYNLVDLTPLGRQETPGRPFTWLRYHDQYDS